VRSILYRFPDLSEFERLTRSAGDEAEYEFGLPAGETVVDGEWILAIFELGPAGRATSAAGRATVSPEGSQLSFEPRDWRRLASFARIEAQLAREAASSEAPEAAPVTLGSPDLDATPSPPGATPIPDTAKSAVVSRTTPIPRASGSGARIMIVDDDPDIRDVVSAMLEAVGLTVVPVPSAEDALDRARVESVDLLVVDWNLPKMSGLDLCRTIRKDPDLSLLPVLFLTANASSQDMVEAFASGGDDYVVKPFRAPELGARIFSLLRRSRLPPL
jgi:two-component system, OmpR family, phosphate regulon response regulator PhoB